MNTNQNLISLNTLIDNIDDKPTEISFEIQTGFCGCVCDYTKTDIQVEDIHVMFKDKNKPKPNNINFDINALISIEQVNDHKYTILTDDCVITIKI